jgi:hypothetical protein
MTHSRAAQEVSCIVHRKYHTLRTESNTHTIQEIFFSVFIKKFEHHNLKEVIEIETLAQNQVSGFLIELRVILFSVCI